MTVGRALDRFERTAEPFRGSTDPRSAGNGSLMRLAPVALAFAHQPREAVRLAGESSRTTHGTTEAVDACRFYACLIVGAVNGATKEELLSPGWSPVRDLWKDDPLAPAIATITAGSYRDKQPPEIQGTGYVVKALEAALWALDGASSFRDACLRAVNLGDDADTTGAIVGQLAGALWGVGGERGVPDDWVQMLALRPTIERLATGLFALATGTTGA